MFCFRLVQINTYAPTYSRLVIREVFSNSRYDRTATVSRQHLNTKAKVTEEVALPGQSGGRVSVRCQVQSNPC